MSEPNAKLKESLDALEAAIEGLDANLSATWDVLYRLAERVADPSPSEPT